MHCLKANICTLIKHQALLCLLYYSIFASGMPESLPHLVLSYVKCNGILCMDDGGVGWLTKLQT